MTDCALAYQKAVRETYADRPSPPRHYFCLFHVSKAIRAKAYALVCRPNRDSLTSVILTLPSMFLQRGMYDNEAMHAAAMAVIYAPRWQDAWIKFEQEYRIKCKPFLHYFHHQWYLNAKHTMKSERDVPLRGIHTNNFNESYHRNLKYHFLGRTSLRRPDDVIHVLADNAEPDFHQTVLKTTLGFRTQRSTKFQNVAKGLAATYTDSALQDLCVKITDAADNTVRCLTPHCVVPVVTKLKSSVHSGPLVVSPNHLTRSTLSIPPHLMPAKWD